MIETSLGLPRRSSAILGNLRQMFGNVRVTLGQILKIFEDPFSKSSETF